MTEPITWQEVTVTLGEIKPWAENPRYSTKAEARRILKSLDQFGQAKPINLSPTNDLYDGHQRLSALLTIKGEGHKIKAWQSSRHLTTEERKQFVLSLHEGAVGQWNFEALGNWDMSLLVENGFDQDALDATRTEMAFLIEMLGEGEEEGQAGEEGDAEPQIDRAAELQAEWGTEVGQLWHIGEHRLLIGDCTVRENVARLMGGEKADMVFTDPPYGMSLNTNYQDIHKGASTGRNFDKIINDDKEFNPSCIFVLDAKEYFLWGADYYKHFLPKGGSWHIWDKTVGRFNGRIGNEFEMCWSKNSHKREIISIEWVGYNGMKEQDTIKRVHPTQKPIELCLHFIKDYSKNNVIDLFLGSGSTMVAAHNLGRKCYGMELSPAYGAVILQRMIDAFPDIDIYKAE